MKRFEVVFRPAAEADLFALYRHIAEDASRDVAGVYIDRIEATCLGLAMSPRRGTRRDDIRKGLRTMGSESRATIVFQVGKVEVTIVRIFYGDRDYERILRRRN